MFSLIVFTRCAGRQMLFSETDTYFFEAPCYCILLDISFQISARPTVPAENTITENSEDSERATILHQFYISERKTQRKSDLYDF